MTSRRKHRERSRRVQNKRLKKEYALFKADPTGFELGMRLYKRTPVLAKYFVDTGRTAVVILGSGGVRDGFQYTGDNGEVKSILAGPTITSTDILKRGGWENGILDSFPHIVKHLGVKRARAIRRA